MSHFAILVITPEEPTQESLSEILMPWHEYECTGYDKYLVDVDETDNVTEQFNAPRKVIRLRPDKKTVLGVHEVEPGSVFDYYDEIFYRDIPTEHGGSRTEFRLPEGAVEEEMSAEEARTHGIGYLTMEECAKEWCGAELRPDGRYYRRTNPNKKWDWWTIGGRWTGMLAVHYNPDEDPANQETCFLCAGTGKRTDMEAPNGCNGCQGTGIKTKWPSQWANVGNSAKISDVPLEALRNEAEIQALKAYDKGIAIIAGRPIPVWEEVRKAHPDDMDAARKAYWNDPVIKDLAAADMRPWEDSDLDIYRCTRIERAQQARRRAIQTFAVVKDGKWYQRGGDGHVWHGFR